MSNKDSQAFRLSRIEAEGWNTAHRVLASGPQSLNDVNVASFNPYVSDPARARWVLGFRNAVSSAQRK
jgi:hypothetical protein